MTSRFRFILLAALVLLAACDVKVEDPNEPAADAGTTDGGGDEGAYILIDQDLTAPATWTAAKVYVVRGSVDVSSTLTLQPGTVVKFDADSSLSVSSPGKILADGAAPGTRIVFTSFKDDAHGGDTNGDGTASTPAAADWSGLSVRSAGSSFQHCEFLYAGGADASALAVTEEGVSLTVRNSVFAHVKGTTAAITSAPALDAQKAGAGTAITGNTFFDNHVPLAIGADFSIDDSNAFDNAAADAANPLPSKHNAIVVYGCGEVKTSITWTATKVPFVIGEPISACNRLDVIAGGQLSLGDGVVVKFFPSGHFNVAGRLTANATSRIVFTSFKDDAHGGDTNGDGTTAAPTGGDWEGINLSASGSSFDRCHFLYAGGGDRPGLLINQTYSATVRNSVFAHHRPPASAIDSAPALDAHQAAVGTVITGNTFYDNTVPLSIAAVLSFDDSNAFDNAAAAPAAPQPNTYNAVIVEGCGDVTGNVTWGGTKVPFVIGDPITACNYLDIAGSGQLTLSDKVVVKFFLGGRINVSGKIIANATTRIVFTSIHDDAILGDTNANSGASAPSGGDWEGINLDASGSSFDKCHLLYGGGANSGANVAVLNVGEGFAATVKNSVIAFHKPTTDAIRSPAALEAQKATAAMVVTGNTFYGNQIPLAISAKMSLDDSNFFDNSAAVPGSPQPNKYNAIIVEGCGDIVGTVVWSTTKVPFVVGDPETACNYLRIPGTGRLTLGNNVTMKFFTDGSITIDKAGQLLPAATDRFTSINDDAVTDTMADGDAILPATGDWLGIKKYTDNDPICYAWTTLFYDTPPVSGACAW